MGPAIQAHALRHFREGDIGIRQRRSSGPPIDPTVAFVAHALHVHDLLVIAAIVEHNAQEWNAMVRGSPQHTRRIFHIRLNPSVVQS